MLPLVMPGDARRPGRPGGPLLICVLLAHCAPTDWNAKTGPIAGPSAKHEPQGWAPMNVSTVASATDAGAARDAPDDVPAIRAALSPASKRALPIPCGAGTCLHDDESCCYRNAPTGTRWVATCVDAEPPSSNPCRFSATCLTSAQCPLGESCCIRMYSGFVDLVECSSDCDTWGAPHGSTCRSCDRTTGAGCPRGSRCAATPFRSASEWLGCCAP